jgi:hypothetical protein
MYTYHVWGIRRSGNHAVIGWILKNRGTPHVHFNDIPDPRNPLAPGGVDVAGLPMWRYKRGLPRKIRHRFFARHHSSFAGSDPSVDYRGLASTPGLACRVFSYEDKLPTQAHGESCVAAPGEVCVSVLLLRDPFNLFASLLKAGVFSRELNELPALYTAYTEQFLRRDETGVVGINYNEWVQNPGYRISTARRLGFETDGSAYDHVPPNGGGSSFSGQSFAGRGSRMDVLGRWRHAATNEDFRRLIRAPQVRSVAVTMFPALAQEVYDTLSSERNVRHTATEKT